MGWVFPSSDTEEPGAEPDPLNGAKSIRELYKLASTNYSGKFTVPVSDLLLTSAAICAFFLFKISISFSDLFHLLSHLMSYNLSFG